jgi:hypothetical protein
MPKLTRVAEIELDGDKYVLAKNGGYCLTRSAGEDAFGTEYFEVVSAHDYGHYTSEGGAWRFAPDRVQALIDKLGDALSSLERARDLRQRQGATGSGVPE